MDRRFVAILTVLVLGFGGFLIYNKRAQDSGVNNQNGTSGVKTTNHNFGEGKKGVVLVEYGDFQCPACFQYFPIVEELREKYKTDITFQFRNFPIDSIHPNARAAHRAAEAADKQGKFWEMYSRLYQTQQEWTSSPSVRPIFEGYAGQLGLDLVKFKADFASSEVNASINADVSEGQKLGVNSTPTFFLDGQKIDNPRGLEEFNKLIDEAISKKNP